MQIEELDQRKILRFETPSFKRFSPNGHNSFSLSFERHSAYYIDSERFDIVEVAMRNYHFLHFNQKMLEISAIICSTTIAIRLMIADAFQNHLYGLFLRMWI